MFFYCHVFVCSVTDRFYVPLLRATDNTLAPVIAGPWCPSESVDEFHERVMTDAPKHSKMTLKAFVGPLNFSKVNHISLCQTCVRFYRR